MKWKPPTAARDSLAIVLADAGDEYWDDDDVDPKRVARKEVVLRKSLDLAKGERENESAVSDILVKAVEAGLYDLASEAARSFSPGSEYSLCYAYWRLFEAKYWSELDLKLAEYCSKRLLKAQEAEAGMYMGDHCPDLRSEGLGRIGLYYLVLGKHDRAFELWQAAGCGRCVDDEIAEFIDVVLTMNADNFDSALMLVDLINTKTVKSKAMSSISDYC